MDKDIVRARFARAVMSYDDNAHVQRQIAGHLSRLIAEYGCRLHESGAGRTVCGMVKAGTPHAASDHSRVLEIGCGTGMLTRKFLRAFRPDRMWLNDLCTEVSPMLEDLLEPGRTEFLPGDAECVAFPDNLDLIMSSSALQWFADLPAFLDKCSSSLRDGGVLAFSSFGPANMSEIAALEGISIPYRTLSELTGLVSDKFSVIHAEESTEILSFGTPAEVLRHMKLTGVTGLRKETWTRYRLQSFCRRYMERFSEQDGSVRLTYHPLYIIARRK